MAFWGRTAPENIPPWGACRRRRGTSESTGFEEADKAKKLIGYLPEQPPLYVNETPLEYLHFVGEAKGLRGTELTRQIREVIDQTKFAEVRNRHISALSKGYKQWVGSAQALLGNPRSSSWTSLPWVLIPYRSSRYAILLRNWSDAYRYFQFPHYLGGPDDLRPDPNHLEGEAGGFRYA